MSFSLPPLILLKSGHRPWFNFGFFNMKFEEFDVWHLYLVLKNQRFHCDSNLQVALIRNPVASCGRRHNTKQIEGPHNFTLGNATIPYVPQLGYNYHTLCCKGMGHLKLLFLLKTSNRSRYHYYLMCKCLDYLQEKHKFPFMKVVQSHGTKVWRRVPKWTFLLYDEV